MLKKRIIPKFLIQNGRLVKGVRFHEKMRIAGSPASTARVYDSYGVDELLFLDIDASVKSSSTVHNIIAEISEEIFMPFTAGGGVRTLEDINDLLRVGADKVSINTAAIEMPKFILEAASRFGDQCITVAIDYKEVTPGNYKVFSHCGNVQTELDPIEHAIRMQDQHCGEILMCSMDRDGTMSGFDLELIERASDQLSIPVVASSGAGGLKDCKAALESGASAITISSMFLFTDHSPIKVRSYLASNGIAVRSQMGSHS